MTHVTCRLTAKNRYQIRNRMLGNCVWATFTFYSLCFWANNWWWWGGPERTCREVVEQDCQARKLNKEDAMDRSRWRKLINDGWWSGWVWVGECFFWYRPTRVVPNVDWECEFCEFKKSRIFTIFKILTNFKNKIRYREKLHTDRTEIVDANVLIRLVMEENSIVTVSRAKIVCQKMSVSNFKHKMQGAFIALCLI